MPRLRNTFIFLALMLAAAGCAATSQATMDESSDVDVRIDGRLLLVHDQDEVPPGIFGTHAVSLSPELIEDLGIAAHRQIHFLPSSAATVLDGDGELKPVYENVPVVIDCPGDRYNPATVLTNPDYEDFFRRIGRQYAERARAHPDRTFYAEFWNEPYLNWASRSHGAGRNHYNPSFYEIDEAEDGGPVTIKGWDEPLEHLRWRRLWAEGEDGNVYYGVDIPEGLEAGDTFEGASPSNWYWTNRETQQFTVIEKWGIEDPTQVGFWSGRQNLQFYLWMFKPWAEAIKETHPDVKVLAGWDFGYSHGDWGVWKELYEPMLEEAVDLIDGLTEHHYGIDTRAVTGWYEVGMAHTMAEHDRWIRHYNTETGGELDPALHGIEQRPEGEREKLQREAARATYTLRDILGLLYHSPAKVGARTEHQFGPEDGPAWALRLLRPVRGSLMYALTDDPHLWPVASLNEGDLVIALFNDATESRRVKLDLAAPAGTTFTTGKRKRLEAGEGGLVLAEHEVEIAGRKAQINVELRAREAKRIVIPLSGEIEGPERVQRTQAFAQDGILHEVEPGEPLTLNIALAREKIETAERAVLRLVLERIEDEAQAVLTLNGTEIAIPARDWTVDLPVDAADLSEANELVFTTRTADSYRVAAASIFLDVPEKP